MASRTRSTKPCVDSDGVRIHKNPGVRTSVWLLTLAMGLVGVAVFMVVRPVLDRRSDDVARADSGAISATGPRRGGPPPAGRSRPASAARLAAPAAPIQNADLTPRGEEGDVPGDVEPSDAAAPAAPNEADAASEERTGIALFPPPGTEPIKSGVVVPEDFELPPGYVRHYQATDDGHRVPAILMFHPDYAPVDDHGAPIPLPADRIVPPEMAPAGMPVQMLEVPDTQIPMIEGPEDHAAQDPTP